MAKTNRSKKGAAKAGLTRNQAFKANRAAQQQERLRQAIQWGEDQQEKKKNASPTVTTTGHRKVRRHSMKLSAQRRRKRALAYLTDRLLDIKDKDKRAPLERTVNTLKSRISI